MTERERFRAMSPAEKAEHIWTYYKWALLLLAVALTILIGTAVRLARAKNPALYVAFVNVSVGDTMEARLTGQLLDRLELDPRHNEVVVYKGLYLSRDAATENHAYAYASQLKLMASVNAQELDVVIMNREAWDILSARGYLLPLEGLGLPEALLVENEVVLSDNELEVLLGEATEARRETTTSVNALAGSPLLAEAEFDGEVYLGILANTPRRAEAEALLRLAAEG